jgi:hypothetical protein
LKYPCQNQGNPENKTAQTAKQKKLSPIGAFAKREDEHEIFIFIFSQTFKPIFTIFT